MTSMSVGRNLSSRLLARMNFWAATVGSVFMSACKVIRWPPIFTFISNYSICYGGLTVFLPVNFFLGILFGEDESVLTDSICVPFILPLVGLFGWNVYSSRSFMKSISSLDKSFLLIFVFLTESACKKSHLFSNRLSCSLCLAVSDPSIRFLSLFGWNGVSLWIYSSFSASLCCYLFRYSVCWRASLYSTRSGE